VQFNALTSSDQALRACQQCWEQWGGLSEEQVARGRPDFAYHAQQALQDCLARHHCPQIYTYAHSWQPEAYAEYLLTVPQITDVERLALLSDYVAARYPDDTEKYMQVMTQIILGVPPGPLAAPRSLMAGNCAGWGRDPHDCPENWEDFMFLTDTSFHPDYQDYHNQVYHFWASVAAIGGQQSPLARGFSTLLTYFGLQIMHEYFQGIVLGSQGASWQDANLTDLGMDLGIALSNGDISPLEVGDWLREHLTTPADIDSELLQSLFPLSGNFEEPWYQQREDYFECLTSSLPTTLDACEEIAVETDKSTSGG